jgi:transcriptional regulator with XRE-family HTH domain
MNFRAKEVRFIEPIDIDVDPSGAPTMAPYVEPIHERWSDEAYEALDAADAVQTRLQLVSPSDLQKTIDAALQNSNMEKIVRKIKRLAKPPETKLGCILRAERTRRGWTHQDVSNRVGIPRREVGKIEQGIPAVPKIEKLMKFVDLYDLNRQYILQVVQEQKNATQKEKETMIYENPVTGEMIVRKDYFKNALFNALENESIDKLIKIAQIFGVPVAKAAFDDDIKFEIQFHCPICGDTVSAENQVNHSMELEKKFRCSKCISEFSVNLTRIIQIHVQKGKE